MSDFIKYLEEYGMIKRASQLTITEWAVINNLRQSLYERACLLGHSEKDLKNLKNKLKHKEGTK
ncbi:hypothetical protein LNTAR_14982 [Lentisphaera araneosa HTCC2155]|uniref:Uncharacterized protein n=1 Tax=Lentisphaera araneosa HTCC2155 TaxID=313628 RepID=A6DHP8_9BACT|nr:hypothetical protein LNTAR_14982 [Lentisphaera araneosa HTCC2155]